MFMDIAQGSLDKIRRPDSTPNMNCSRVSDRDSPVDDKTSKVMMINDRGVTGE